MLPALPTISLRIKLPINALSSFLHLMRWDIHLARFLVRRVVLMQPLSEQVITTGGYREPINLQQIRTNMEMESHEEKLHNMIKISKMESARESAKDAAKVIRERQREQGRMTGIGGGEPSMHASMHTPTPSYNGKD